MSHSEETRLQLQIDLEGKKILTLAGYHPNSLSVERGRLRAAVHHRDGEIDYFFRGTLYGHWSAERFMTWLHAFDLNTVSKWLDTHGDFNLIVWNREARTAVAVTDRVGAHRLYAHCDGSIATLTSRIGDQAWLQRQPVFDQHTIHTMLTMGYSLDPWSVLRDTWIAGIGTAVVCSGVGAQPKAFYSPVTIQADNYETISDCITGIGESIGETLANHLTTDATPLVMLSGGIDSLVLLRYATEFGGDRVEALTFAVEGREVNELNEARIAARYYGVKHHCLIISSADIEVLMRRALANIEVFGYGGLEHQGISEYLRAFGQPLAVIRGEDTRLHTPPLDLPTRLGLALNASSASRSQGLRFAWQAQGLLRHWPIRRGRNYLRYVADKTELHDDLFAAVLATLLRFRYPGSWVGPRAVPVRIDALRQEFPRNGTMEQIFRWAVSVAYRLQYTDDMHAAHTAVDSATSTLVLPYYVPEVVHAMNRVSFAMAMKRTVASPRLTGSPFPLADKYVLRQLMKGTAPPELLFRRKATAGAPQAQFEHAGRAVILAGLKAWSPALLQKLEGPSWELASYYLDEILSSGTSVGSDGPMAGMALRMLSLSVLSWHIDHPCEDLMDAAMVLPPWLGN